METVYVVNQYGQEICFDAAVLLMDYSIREQLNGLLAPCAEQEFFDAYCYAHERIHGKPFFLAEENPQW